MEGATTIYAVFEAYVERMPAPPGLRAGRAVVMGNLAAHNKGERVGEPIEPRGCEALYLPPYPPDLDPIEEAFSKIEALPRRAAARTREAPIGALGEAITTAVGPRDALGFFEHRGYRRLVQPL